MLSSLAKVRLTNETLNKKLCDLREQTADESVAIKALERECEAMERNVSELNTQQAEIREESSEAKAMNQELREALSQKTLKLEELRSFSSS